MRFEFASVGQIVFGPGTLAELPKHVRGWGARALIVCGKSATRATRVRELLTSAEVQSDVFCVEGEPTISTISAGVSAARSANAQFVVGFGGGSAIDAAKAIAGMLTNPGDVLDYLEVVGKGQALSRPAAPWIAIPTTAGTGAEVTRNAVLAVPESGMKVSLRSTHLFARVALVDPELTLDLPADVTAYTAMDALTQLIEARVTMKANPLTSALCDAAIPRVARAIEKVHQTPSCLAARTDLAYGSLTSGLALANAGLGTVHGFAAVIGGMFKAPHGAICATLLAPVMTANISALKVRAMSSSALEAYTTIGQQLSGATDATAEDGAAWAASLVSRLSIPGLAAFGVRNEHVDTIVERTQQASSTKGNPVVLGAEELKAVLMQSLR
jgi:alcohol dehydrogenase class IV